MYRLGVSLLNTRVLWRIPSASLLKAVRRIYILFSIQTCFISSDIRHFLPESSASFISQGRFAMQPIAFSFIGGGDIVLSGNRRDAISVDSIDVTHSSGAEIAKKNVSFFPCCEWQFK